MNAARIAVARRPSARLCYAAAMTPPLPPPAPRRPPVCGLILAGGLGRRMGGVDKALLPLAGRPLLTHAIAALAPQVDRLALSANGDPARFSAFGLPVVPDPLPDHPGPLAGILAGLEALQGEHWLVSVPADAPFLPHDLVKRLLARQAETGSAAVFAASGTRTHPATALWRADLASLLRSYLLAGERRVGRFLAQIGAGSAIWETVPQDPFTNINTPEDLAWAEQIVAS